MRHSVTMALVELHGFNANIQITTTTLTAPPTAAYTNKNCYFSHNAFSYGGGGGGGGGTASLRGYEIYYGNGSNILGGIPAIRLFPSRHSSAHSLPLYFL